MNSEEIDRAAFGGHETFPFRYTWLPKAVRFAANRPALFAQEDAMVTLGVGKNMVRSIRHWALACGVLEERPNSRGQELEVTPLGKRLFDEENGWDPYLEDPATIWLLHWQIARQPKRATTWYWVFSHLPQPEFSRNDLVGWLRKLAQENEWTKASEASIRRDVDCFVRSYVATAPSKRVSIEETLDCPLVELGLIREYGGRGNFLLLRGDRPTLPDEFFGYALVEFIRLHSIGTKTLSLNSIAYSPGSPGRVLGLDEDSVLARLEKLSGVTAGALSFDDTAGLRQVLIHRRVDALELLERCFLARTAVAQRATMAAH